MLLRMLGTAHLGNLQGARKMLMGPKMNDNDREADVIPATDEAKVKDTSTMEERRAAEQRATALIKAHCDKFMKRAFPPK
jgi:hypothetical protein